MYNLLSTSPLQYFSSAEISATMTPDELYQMFQRNQFFDFLYLCRIVDCFRSWCNAPIRLTSTYRSLAHNSSIKNASPTSQHMLGQAVDFQLIKDSEFTANMFKNFLLQKKELKHSLGQVILYPTFVHISRPNKNHPYLDILDKRINS